MKLLELHINGFGKFHDRTITFGDGLNLIYGKNEAGKSTLHTFIRGMLFGIERGRGRAAKNDLYSKYEPWENSGIYEGWLRVECDGTVYRIERNFQKDHKSLEVINETRGLPETETKELLDHILGGLTETTYNNTISIGQLKSATEDGMVSELRNYIANMNTTGNVSLNITKATAFLRNQKRTLESTLNPEASREYTALLAEIHKIDEEVSSPEYENQALAYQELRTQIRNAIENIEAEKDSLSDMVQKGREVLDQNQLTDMSAIEECKRVGNEYYTAYQGSSREARKKSRTVFAVIAFILAAAGAGGAVFLFLLGFFPICIAPAGAALLFLILGIVMLITKGRWKKRFRADSEKLSALFGKYLGDTTISDDALNSFNNHMDRLSKLCAMVVKLEADIRKHMENINALQTKQNSFSEQIEQNQKTQWELEKKLEHLNTCRTKAASLKHVLADNDRIRDEIAAVDLAMETLTDLSMTIRDSFGFYLNQEASRLISGITGGIYDSISVDESLNLFMNTKTKLIPIDQLSSGTMDQVYLALRLAAAKLIQGDQEIFPLIFDDSFTQYDDDRLHSALEWLAKAYDGQMIIFTCHRREMEFLDAKAIPHELIEI